MKSWSSGNLLVGFLLIPGTCWWASWALFSLFLLLHFHSCSGRLKVVAAGKSNMAEMLSSGVVRKLADIAGNLIAREGSRLSELEENINWIREEMSSIKTFLENADAVESEIGGLADFIRSTCDLAYDLEDIMEEYFPKLSPPRRNGWKGRLGWLWKAKTVRDFAVEIEKLKRRAVDIKRRRKTYKVPDATGCPGKQGWDPRRTFPHTDEVNVVGMDKHIKELEAKVTDQDSVHRVISIRGMAGIGKTTLARKVYNSVRKSFECSAWIYVSQQPNPYGLLHDIARQVGLTEKQQKQDLEGNLFRHLSLKRYVIVIDDIWQIEPWNALKNGIPVNSMNGSRIIITSRSNDICRQIGGQNFLHELQHLDEEKSRELFFKVVMAAPQDNDEDGDPSQLKNIGEKILKKCGGVPLAIVVIAGVLLSRDRSIQAWKGVLESIGKDGNQCSKIFALSYKDLPSMLKPCFLYFGLFPEDHEISTFRLINLWAAEGFIHDSGVRAVEDVGQDYLNQLVGRNLIQVVNRRCDGTVRFCRIHDLLHDLSISKAGEMNFLNTLNNVATSAYCLAPRRVTTSSQIDARNYVSSNHQTPKLRALLCFNDFKMIGRLRNFNKSLRVLILMDPSGLGAPMNEIVKLKHLYHLELGGEYIIELPYAISNLENLLTLDLKECAAVILTEVIWKMKQLRHILLPPDFRASSVCGFHLDCHRFHSFEVSLPNLQTLFGLPVRDFEANWLHKLDSLRRLEIHLITKRIIGVLSSANSLSQKLEELRIISSDDMKSALDLSRYVSLRKLYMHGSGIVDFARHDKLPICLTELILHGTRLEMDPMVILKKLPRLKILVLEFDSYLGKKKMVCSGEADSFPQLEVLRIFANSLEEFVAEEGAMPKLKHLTLSHSIPTVKVPDRIRNIIMIDPFMSGRDELDADP
ncbi:toMV resistant protein Tm-2 netted virescent-like [Diospyros lotus]|uniref:toMV resistant protein Tm-2 netted virescent-like n=1 Tax=Diospyros lotus TaxID=55363 RepID=UPI00224F2253|nr:toMV resistant protein Tm-2 netted virescent-like [Diospyros lotus]